MYLDLIKDRQTYLTRTLELKNGRTRDKVTFDAMLAGTVQINAYFIGKNGVIVRDRRLVLVDPADDLSIKVSSDSETYLPGTKAKLKFRVTNKRGKGIASALGVMVVDEAVFALQEMQPGLEKVYFYLEKEIATPRYEIHGYELDDCITPPISLPDPRPLLDARREKAARVLLASAKGVGDYPLHVNTYQRDNKAQAFQQKMAQHMMPRYQKVRDALNKLAQKLKRDKISLKKGVNIDRLVEDGYLAKPDSLDPWGGVMKIQGRWCQNCRNYHGFVLLSAGIDGKWSTADDASVPAGAFGPRDQIRFNGRRNWFGKMNGLAMEEAAVPMAMAGAPMKQALVVTGPESGSSSAVGGGAEPIRIREYFPETLYFNPAVITDGRGRAVLNIPMADSITTWRLTCMASSAAGQLGSTTAGIRVFQDFFVDIDFPVSLTQNDQVHVPVAIYNYLKTDQKIQLEVKKENWFELEGLAEKTVTLSPSEVRAVYFPITVRKIGFQKFTVTARGTKKSDAVARSVEIRPDGKEHLLSESGRLKGTISHTITIPESAIDDASKIFVKIYPGVLSQIAEGLEKMLRMPFGCFEQTSSVTYPNILVLDYMKSTGKITPELQMKAEGFINAGYQRLVSYEVPGGGFEWFGKAPAHRILTAYGLMEFYDMSKVYEVDPAIITRTQQWLAKCQDKDGSYTPSAGGIREGAINKFTDDVFRNTAYITWALASTG
ncbi:MAG: alpha-2-macroglobulin family protein, partial [Planctomycetota bacterium]